jgi:hypothetical protein
MPAHGEAGEPVRERMAEVVVDAVEQLGRRLLRLHVDRDAIRRPAVVDELDLVVRSVRRALTAPGDRPRLEDPVGVEGHARRRRLLRW